MRDQLIKSLLTHVFHKILMNINDANYKTACSFSKWTIVTLQGFCKFSSFKKYINFS